MTLYERTECHLCAETFRALHRIALDRPLTVTRVDIDGDTAVERRYALRVPVLRIGAAELDAAGLDDPAIARWIGSVVDADAGGLAT